MADMFEYAKREAEQRFWPPVVGGSVTPETARRLQRAAHIEGILHLAGRLAEDDVIEATARSIRATITESPGKSWNHHARAALAAMLAKIAESSGETGS